MVALRKPVSGMSVAEFLAWEPGTAGKRWQLRDGEPEMMAPASDVHGSIQGELARLIGNHLAGEGACRVVVTPGVIPRVRSAQNFLIPDLGITCTQAAGGTSIPDPVALIEILSPSNERETRANVWAFTTIPSVREIVLIRSTSIAAELWRRRTDGSWPEQAAFIGADDDLALDTIGFRVALRAAYRTAGFLPT
jgi:Uma2 family endonuclease